MRDGIPSMFENNRSEYKDKEKVNDKGERDREIVG